MSTVQRHSKRRLRERNLPVVEGTWLSSQEGIFRTFDGRMCVSWRYLCSHEDFQGVSHDQWYTLAPDPDRNKEGRVRAFHVKNPNRRIPGQPPRSEMVTVWLLDDAERVIRDRKRRPAPEGRKGKWLADGHAWNDEELGTCLSDADLAKAFADDDDAELYTPEVHFYGYWRRRPHEALKGVTPDGKPRTVRRGKKFLSCLSDFTKIVAWARAQRKQYQDQDPPPAGWMTAAELLTQHKVRSSQAALAHAALSRFREAHPSACSSRLHETHNNSLSLRWWYDPSALRSWLGKRNLIEAEEQVLPNKGGAVKRQRIERAKLFLFYILTAGEYRPIRFGQFAAAPPYRKRLKPSRPVPREDVCRWAAEAGIGQQGIWDAAREIGVKRVEAGNGSRRMLYYLEDPVVIPPPQQEVDGQKNTTPSTQAGDEPRRRGRPKGATDKKAMLLRDRIRMLWNSKEYGSHRELARYLRRSKSTVSRALEGFSNS